MPGISAMRGSRAAMVGTWEAKFLHRHCLSWMGLKSAVTPKFLRLLYTSLIVGCRLYS